MKTKLILLAACIAVLISGCSMFEEYEVGAEITSIVGNKVTIKAMVWTYDDSGPIPHKNWFVGWGDGTSDTKDTALVMEHILRWDHTYEQTGSYTISISCGGSLPAIFVVDLE